MLSCPGNNLCGNGWGLFSLCVCLFVCLFVCLSVCLSCSGSNSWKPWPRNFVIGKQVLFGIFRSSSYIKVIGSRSRSDEHKCQTSATVYIFATGEWKSTLLLVLLLLSDVGKLSPVWRTTIYNTRKSLDMTRSADR